MVVLSKPSCLITYSFRSLTNPAFLLLDELDFIRKSDQDDIRHVSERYIGKSDPYIVMVFTPNMPGSLFEKIQKEPEETCIYKKLFPDYNYGLGKIYTTEEIDKAKKSPSFEREYCLKFAGRIGNLLSQLTIDTAVKTGELLKDIPVNPYCIHSLGIDPAWGSTYVLSATGLQPNGQRMLRPDLHLIDLLPFCLVSPLPRRHKTSLT